MDDLTRRVTDEGTLWARTRPYVRSARIAPLARLLTAASPFADARALTTQLRLNLWVFAVDDLFDDPASPLAELRRFTASCGAVLAQADQHHHHHSGANGPLVRCLAGIRDETAEYRLFPTLADLWNDGVLRMLHGMLDEARWTRDHLRAGAATLPDLAEYLRSAYSSIGARPHFRTMLVTTGDGSTPDHLPLLLRMEKEASLAIRLANDLRSHPREDAEGAVNAVLILRQQAIARGLPPPAALRAARKAVQYRFATHLTRCRQLGRHPVTASGRPEAVILRTAALTAALYRHGDFLPPASQPRGL